MKQVVNSFFLFICYGLVATMAFAETALFKGKRYQKQDIDSCKEEAAYENFEEAMRIDYIETCLEDFQGIDDYADILQSEKNNK